MSVFLYLDASALNRPLDERTQLRVALEAEAVLQILASCEAGIFSLAASDVLLLENQRNPHPQRKAFVSAVLSQARSVITVRAPIRQRAKALEARGFREFDALHVACAEYGKVDFFCTCDDRLLKGLRRERDIAVRFVSPLELAKELTR